MSEANQNNEYIEGDVKIKTSFSAWLDNFLYHYKWHAIAVLFIIFVVVICTVQTCSKTSYDLHVVYAGDKDVKMSADAGKKSEYEELLLAIRKYSPDRDGDGNRNVSLQNLYLPSAEEIARLEALIKELKEKGEESFEISYSLISNNQSTFESDLIFGDYHIYFISDSLLFANTKTEASNPFTNIRGYLPEGSEAVIGNADTESGGYVLASEYGVYLHSTPLANEPGFSSLPENTVIALRKYSPQTSGLSTVGSEEYFRYNEGVLRNLLSGKADF